ncbi:MAG: hypothetical protein Q4C53_05590 [Clostridia bacterium]|nr:hypothetical protein [Clostridia bacterium]
MTQLHIMIILAAGCNALAAFLGARAALCCRKRHRRRKGERPAGGGSDGFRKPETTARTAQAPRVTTATPAPSAPPEEEELRLQQAWAKLMRYHGMKGGAV